MILTEAATDFKQKSYTVESGERKTVRRKECVSRLDENLREIPDMQEVCVLETPDTRIALAAISRQWFDNPQKELCILGVTGTKGKTTTVWMYLPICGQIISVQGNMQILQNIWIASGSCFAGAGAEYSIRMTLTGRKCGGKVAVRL